MENIIGFNNNVLIKWRLLRNDGQPFPLDQVLCKICAITGRGRTEIKSFSISGADSNIVSWQMNNRELRFLGSCSLAMSIVRRGLQIATVEYRNAFQVTSRAMRNCGCVQTVELTSFVNVLHPESVPGSVNVLFPTFEIGPDMHLYLKSDTEQYLHNFELAPNGHLLYKND